ncbi:MAG: mechanosensitive ion channel, partial [Chloroflexi bacterium]|nr:mechanosensitive ion channel [Chloroflexota bacterium]
MDEGIRYSLVRAVEYGVIALGAVISLQMIGLDLTTLGLVFGLLSLGIGFGLQNLAANFVSGLIALIERPVKIGDRVQIGDAEGDVIAIDMRATVVRGRQRLPDRPERRSDLVDRRELVAPGPAHPAERAGRAVVRVGRRRRARDPARGRARTPAGALEPRAAREGSSSSGTPRGTWSCSCGSPVRSATATSAPSSTSRSCGRFARAASRSPSRSATSPCGAGWPRSARPPAARGRSPGARAS